MNEDVCHQLSDWASSMYSGNAAKLSIQPPQNPEDLQYICKGPMVDIWKYVTKHVHPTQKVKKVKGNLMLKCIDQPLNANSHVDANVQNIKSRHSDITSQISTKEVILNGNLTSSIKQLQKSIKSSERSCQMEQKAITECRHRLALLSAYEKIMEKKLDHLILENCDVNSNISKLTSHQRASKDTYVSQNTVNNSECKIEKISLKRVRDSCIDIEKYLRMNIFKDDNLEKTALFKLMAKLRKRMEEIVSKQSPIESLDAVLSHLSEAVAEMKKLTDEVDLLKDAQLFVPKDENASLPPKDKVVENSVEALLSKKRYEHVMTFLRCQNFKQEIQNLDMDIQNLEVEFNRLVDSMTDDNDKEAIRIHMMKETKEIGLTAAINEITKELIDLEVKIEAHDQSENELQCKYEQIQSFERSVKFKQDVIQTLLKEFIHDNQKLDESVQEIEKSQEVIRSGSYCTDQLQNWIQNDTDSFFRSNLSSLIVMKGSDGLKVNRAFLSILREFKPRDEIWRQVLEEMRYPLHKDYNILSHHIHLAKENFTKLQLFQECLENLQIRLNTSSQHHQTSSLNCVQDLIEKTKKHDEELVRDLVPLLKKANVNVNKCIDLHCKSTQDALYNWWEQPAHKAMTDMKVDDKSFQDWMSLWTLAIIQLKNTEKK